MWEMMITERCRFEGISWEALSKTFNIVSRSVFETELSQVQLAYLEVTVEEKLRSG
jgi:hypothetical protein